MGDVVGAHESTVTAVSAHDAAAWLTGQPAYDTEWPECRGVCIKGKCALRWHHPACCFVRPSDRYRDQADDGRPYVEEREQDMLISSFGYWRSRDWYWGRENFTRRHIRHTSMALPTGMELAETLRWGKPNPHQWCNTTYTG
jgi:hypothetical protein